MLEYKNFSSTDTHSSTNNTLLTDTSSHAGTTSPGLTSIKENVLVTGAAGFIGAHAALHFANKGYNVRAIDNMFRTKNHTGVPEKQNLPLLNHENIFMKPIDVRNQEDLREQIKNVKYVIHAAGQTSVSGSINKTLDDFYVNTAGAINLLQACREEYQETGRKVRAVIMSTNKVYGSKVNNHVTHENNKRYTLTKDFPNGIPESLGIGNTQYTPYGASMASRDLYTQTFNNQDWVDAAIFRSSCIYGPHQLAVKQQGWITWFIKSTLNKQPITIHGDGKQVRDVLHVNDLINAMDNYLLNNKPSGTYNIGGGPSNSISILEALDLISNITGEKQDIQHKPWRPNDQKVYISNISKARNKLGWEPRTNYKQGIRNLINHMENKQNVN